MARGKSIFDAQFDGSSSLFGRRVSIPVERYAKRCHAIALPVEINALQTRIFSLYARTHPHKKEKISNHETKSIFVLFV